MDEYDDVLRQQEKVRRSGEVNMFNKSGVQQVAHEKDFHALVTWIEEHDHSEYINMAQEAAEQYREADL